jgi:predicted phosphodiesterase
MRIGLLSDVHANLFALQAAIARLEAEGVDAWVCAGDLVGYGPHPNECVETIAELEPTCVAGNHELMLLNALPVNRAGWLARRTIAWTRDVVRPDVRAYLAGLPQTATFAEIALAHGSPNDPQEYVRTDERASMLLRTLLVGRLLVLGHTHHPWLYGTDAGTVFPAADDAPPGSAALALTAHERYLINPGAVGQSREREPVPRTRFALVDLDRAEVHFFAEPYDASATQAALRARRLPPDTLHVRPGRVAAATRRVRRLLHQASRA